MGNVYKVIALCGLERRKARDLNCFASSEERKNLNYVALKKFIAKFQCFRANINRQLYFWLSQKSNYVYGNFYKVSNFNYATYDVCRKRERRNFNYAV